MIKLIQRLVINTGLFTKLFTSLLFIGGLFFYASVSASNLAPIQTKSILILGDSISAGYGLKQGQSWTNLLQTRLTNEQYPYKVINASLSGDTTHGGSKRLKKSLKLHHPDIVIIELGGNDGLRGLSLKKMKSNLAYMINLSQQNKHRVLLVGMRLPPNYGPSYTKQFFRIYQTLATEKETALVPFMFEGIADKTAYFQADQIHPNASAQIILLDNIWQALQPMLSHESPHKN